MGKGDQKTQKGKRYRGTYGRTRPKPSRVRKRRRQNRESSDAQTGSSD